MAVKDSGEIATNSNYILGDYSFRIERTSVPGSTNDKIEAICTDKDGKNARKSIQIPSSSQITYWTVEANETEATVYAYVEGSSPSIPSVEVVCDTYRNIEYFAGGYIYPQYIWSTPPAPGTYNKRAYEFFGAFGATSPVTIYLTKYWDAQNSYYVVYGASKTDCNTRLYISTEPDGSTAFGSSGYFGYLRNSVFSEAFRLPYSGTLPDYVMDIPESPINPNGLPLETTTTPGEYLVARFAIDIEDAGGVGPEGGTGGGWTDPGDYDEDWEEGDPTHTLYVTVTGALSGRHNDPIVDPSYSYIPADKDTVKDYGCGGDGGHGGGGGAGASTVVIHKFATNQANSKEVTAIARRHGYGSGGGKGGKGGDGCILVYY